MLFRKSGAIDYKGEDFKNKKINFEGLSVHDINDL